jgi:hypothetical protein
MSDQGFFYNVINKMRGNNARKKNEHFSKEIFNDPVEKKETFYDFPPAKPGALEKIRQKLRTYNINLEIKIWVYTSLILGFGLTLFFIIF